MDPFRYWRFYAGFTNNIVNIKIEENKVKWRIGIWPLDIISELYESSYDKG
jgi:hypothetical protein